jgi:hypothetical protein
MKQFMADCHSIEMLDMTKADHTHRAPELGTMPVSTMLLLWLIMLFQQHHTQLVGLLDSILHKTCGNDLFVCLRIISRFMKCISLLLYKVDVPDEFRTQPSSSTLISSSLSLPGESLVISKQNSLARALQNFAKELYSSFLLLT